MGSTLTNTQPKDTYKSLLKTSDSTELSATAKYVSDGNGNDSALALSTTAVGIGTASPNRELTVNGEIQATNAVLTGALYLGGTAAANSLDDYEEGTFTPTVAFSGASAGITYSEQAGKYTKIGRQVTVEFEIVLTSKGSSTGRIEIGNLPFTSIASQFTGAVELRNVTFTQKYAIVEIGRAAGTFFRVILMDSASNSAQLTDADVANDSAFLFSATYFV